jgi:hypothetical protein
MTVEWGYAVRDLAASQDFDDEVKRATAALTADRCSNPHCRALTSGPTNDRRKSLTVGVIAPISAMRPGGHRYDATLSDAERHDHGNAIWLCYTCARQVNYDVAHFPADMLRSWKKEAGGTGGE